MDDILVASASLGALANALFAASLVADYRRSVAARRLFFAVGLSALWWLSHVAYYSGLLRDFPFGILLGLEVARDAGWSFCLLWLFQGAGETGPRAVARQLIQLGLIASVLVAVLLLWGPGSLWGNFGHTGLGSRLGFCGLLALSVVGLSLVEVVYRNTPPVHRWSIKYLCLGVAALHGYDLVLYADGVLFDRLESALWAGRGAANALAVPLIAVAVARNRNWNLNLFVSRQIVFQGTTLLGAGLYLLGVAAAGYYLRTYGGEWGAALRVVFFFAALMALTSMLGSATLRARLRRFLARHFYRDKYDYGEIWLRFTNQLSQGGSKPSEMPRAILAAIADIMEATGGVMWQRTVTNSYGIVASVAVDPQRLQDIPEHHPLLNSLRESGQILDIAAEAGRVSVEVLERVPAWLLEQPRAWLLMPIVHRDELLAFVLLCESRADQVLGPEDRELLGTIGRQAAAYLALMQSNAALADARQFEAFNRLAAFLVHDLKNVIAQLSMVLRNGERHRSNPEFIADAFNTVGDAVAKMNRMLGNLKHTHEGPVGNVELAPCLREVTAHLAGRQPAPVFRAPPEPLKVRGNRDRLIALLTHLAQNAQEATSPDGRVELVAGRVADRVVISVIDTGAGMSPEFIRDRLFKPFDTTKGKAGMGIGVYESLHIVSGMGGRMNVDSVPGRGTTFRIELPLAWDTETGHGNQESTR